MTQLVDFLEKRLEQSIGFVRFSETKNAALLAASVALLLAELQLLKDIVSGSCSHQTLMITIVLLIIGFLVSLLSIIPQSRSEELSSTNNVIDINSVNTVYFGEYKELSSEVYVKLLVEKFDWELATSQYPLALDLADQCIQNGSIAMRKLKYFKIGSLFFAISLVFLLITVII